jgi:glyoxylate reductase
MNKKATVYFASPVFREIATHSKVSDALKAEILKLIAKLEKDANVIWSDKRFPSAAEILDLVKTNNVDFIGCHLSHQITKEIMEYPSVKAVSTSTAGFNHIAMVPGVIITNTPSVLDKTVGDFTLALILANLRNLLGLHNFLWSGAWNADQKWDLDENLNNTMDNLVLGIVGMGEIGREMVRRVGPWGVKIIYYDVVRNEALEHQYPNVSFRDKMEDIFSEGDIVSLHIPLIPQTKGIVNATLLRKMKKNALLVNTARGPIVNENDLIQLLKSKEISINLAFDVYDPEPISKEHLIAFQEISKDRPELRFVFIPHNASADADTRAKMDIIVLEDLIALVNSKSPVDLKSLRIVPPLKKDLSESTSPNWKSYKIQEYWK